MSSRRFRGKARLGWFGGPSAADLWNREVHAIQREKQLPFRIAERELRARLNKARRLAQLREEIVHVMGEASRAVNGGERSQRGQPTE